VVLLPLATGAAILRYRLYDLDRIISRTVAYGLLTVLLGVGYAAVVLGLGRLLPEDSSLVVAAATLAVAAAFQPARRRVQRGVDRRFNRRRHDAGRIIEAFGARLRDQVDLDTLTAEVLAVVDQTMQPTHASLWLHPQESSNAIAAGVDAATWLVEPTRYVAPVLLGVRRRTEPEEDSKPRPSDYESDVRRRSGWLQTDLGCSGWMRFRSRRL
jgi:hypothetical protein